MAKFMKFFNPLLEPIQVILEAATQAMSEYQLMQYLQTQGYELSLSAQDNVALFRSHFLVYNALYQLQDYYWQNNRRFLRISALAIVLEPLRVLEPLSVSEPLNNEALSGDSYLSDYTNDHALRTYYLDITQLEQVSEQSVQALLDSFWQRYVADDELSEALNVFTLTTSSTSSELKQQYRRLAMQHHPDRGGDIATFQKINWAFGVLQVYFS